MPVNYANGKIYTIRCHEEPELIYVGSTTQTLSMRLAKHKSNMKSYGDGKCSNVTSFQIIKHPSAYIELLELFPCDSKIELHKREGELMRKINCVNRCIAGRTPKEYYDDNKEKILLRKKKYHDDNKEKISAQRAEKITCECGVEITRKCLKRHQKTKKHLGIMANKE